MSNLSITSTNTKTPSEIDQLEERLKHLRDKRRELKQKIYNIKQALTWQDMIDNQDWLDCRGKIIELTEEIELAAGELSRLKSSEHAAEQEVHLGSQVVLGKDDGQTVIYRLVDSFNADPSKGYISDESPLGHLILGKRLYDMVKISNLRSKMKDTYRIVAIV